MSERYLGIDVHKRFCVFCEIDADGETVRRGRFANTFEEVSVFACTLSARVHLVLEPVLNYLWLLDQLEPYVGSVHISAPGKVRVIAESKCKTDRYDSLILAELLRTNFLPESYFIPSHVRSLRSLIRQRFHLMKHKVMLKNRIRHLLFLNGSKITARDVSSTKGIKEISCLNLPDSTREAIEQCQAILREVIQTISSLDLKIHESCQGIQEISLLMTIPGIGAFFAATIYAEIVDVCRFRSSKAFCSYAGLVPAVRASGDHVHLGRITRTGSSPLRFALVEAAITAARKSAALRRLYYRVLHRSNSQKARVAVARKLAVIIYAMLLRGDAFHG